jgi:hypothetical protein
MINGIANDSRKIMTAELSKSVLKKAKAAHKKLFNRIGTQISENSSEKVLLCVSYPVKYCNKVDGIWDIPSYTNGTTRRTQCIFLIPSTAVGDGAYAYSVSNNTEMEERFKESDMYDREKVLASERVGKNLIEIVWSFDFSAPNRDVQQYYSIDKFWFGVKVNDTLTMKRDELKDLMVTDMKQKCPYCEKTKDISKMTLNVKRPDMLSFWTCKSSGRLYEKCPD